MGNYAFKKEQAIIFNERRLREKREAAVLALDKLENPEKYNRRNRRATRTIMPFIALSAAISFSI